MRVPGRSSDVSLSAVTAFIAIALIVTSLRAAAVTFTLIILMATPNGSTTRSEVHGFESFDSCRTRAHQVTGDPRRIDQITHEFRSRSGLTTAYCVTQRGPAP